MAKLVDRTHTEKYFHPRIPLVRRIRFQLLGAMLVAVVLPVLLRVMINPTILYLPPTVNSIIATCIAIFFGYLTWRRFVSFASVEATGYVISSFLASFLLVMTFLFFFRLDYSRFIFFTSMGLTLVWFVALHSWISLKYPIQLGVIEGGFLNTLPDVCNVRLIKLPEPSLEFADINGVVIDLRYDHAPKWLAFITHLTLRGIPVFHYKEIEEAITGQVAIDHLHENSFGSLLPSSMYLRVKNRLEQGLALVLLPPILIICLITALAILMEEGRPIFYTQTRMGFRGVPFTAYKFRTMRNGYSKQSPIEDAVTKKNDPRITRLGSFLRKYRIDELPQVLNILRGEMGWIGPRPEALELSKRYEEKLPFYLYRYAVRPGITGWAQVKQGHVTSLVDVNEKLKYDFYYVKKVSIWLDFLIILKTIRVVLFGLGAK